MARVYCHVVQSWFFTLPVLDKIKRKLASARTMVHDKLVLCLLRMYTLSCLGGIAPNKAIPGQSTRCTVKCLRSKSNEGCDWCIYVTVVTCADTMTYTLCIQ